MNHEPTDPERPIFVFGSNREGRHGAGAAFTARLFYGAVYGQPSGLQGNSYAIITKELRPNHPPVSLPEIEASVSTFLDFARSNPHLLFFVTPIGCGLAGFNPSQIAPFFKDSPPPNISLPSTFLKILAHQTHLP
jgi:hypothetical protein